MAAGPDTLLCYVRRLALPAAPEVASDAALLGRFVADRDERAFAALVDRHGPLVLHVCRRVLGDADDAEDAFQATFLVLARRAAAVRPAEALPAWLYGVARRVALKARATQARRRAARPAGAPVADPRPDPLAELSARELLRIVDEEVQRLPEAQRLPVLLCCLEGRSLEEAARYLGWTRGSVKGRLERGRARLHTRLVRRGLTLSAALAAAEVSRGVASAALAAATARGALLFAMGATTARELSPPAAALAGDVLQGMALGKLKTAAVPGLLLGLLAAAAGLVAYAPDLTKGTEPPGAHVPASVTGREHQEGEAAALVKTDAESPDSSQAPLTDLYGDPLPAGARRRLGTLRFRHGGGTINSLLVASDGNTLVTQTFYGDPTVCAWDLATGKLLHQFPGHHEGNGAVALTPDGKTVAVGHDYLIRFYDLASGREVRQLRAPLGQVQGLAVSHDGKTLASGHARQTVLLWDLASGTSVAQLPAGHNRLTRLAFTADDKTLVTGDAFDPRIRLFDVVRGKERQPLFSPNARSYRAREFVLSPKGTLLALAQPSGLSLWDLKTGRLVRELRGASSAAGVAFSPDGKILASAESDEKASRGTLVLWDVATGKQLRRLNGNPWPVAKLAFTRDGQRLIVGCGGTIRLWDRATGNECGPAVGNPVSVGGVALAPDGRTLAYQADEAVRLQDLAEAREGGRLPSRHWSLAFSPDGQTLAGGATVNQINLWEVASMRVRRLQSTPKGDGFAWVGYHHVAFAPDGKWLAAAGPGLRVGGTDDAVVQLWRLDTGKPGLQLTLKDDPNEFCYVEAVAFSPDGKTLAASGRGNNSSSKVRVWEVATGKPRERLSAALNDPAEKEPALARWDPQTPLIQPRLAFSPDGKQLTLNRLEKPIPVWEAATGRVRVRLPGHQAPTVCVAFAPDGLTLASAGWDNTIRLWDLVSGKELRQLTGHRGPAEALAFTPDGKTLISAGHDTTILLWDVAAVTGRPLPAFALPTPPEWEALWTQLAGDDAVQAYQAMHRLTAAPKLTLASLGGRLRPSVAVEPPRLGRLLGDLDSSQFAVRERAARQLEKLGESAEPELRRALARKGSSLEFRRRLERILDHIQIPSGAQLQELRAVEVLEQIGTSEAQETLRRLTQGTPEARLTHEAAAALERLARRTTERPR
jgi:RNA polymerase sigma factor (sigma-70 family)